MFYPTRRKPATVALTAFLFLFLGTQSIFAEEQPATYTDPVLGMELVLIQGGTFVMGDITGRDIDSIPPHRVAVPDFYIGKYEVTFDQYDQFCDATGREKPSDEGWGRGSRPVINVSWIDAVEFTLWMSEQTGREFRLPSEAQWEYAARGGTSTNYWWGSGLGSNLANCRGCGSPWDGKKTAPVGSFAPNPFGLYDTAGNVYEWCLDTYHPEGGEAPADGAPWLSGDINQHIMKSGSWYMPSREIKSFMRAWDRLDEKQAYYGFRVAMTKK